MSAGARSSFPFDAFSRVRWPDGPRCPHCAASRISQWGRHSGRRRYRCLQCRRTFNDLTGTPFAYLKRLDAWSSYFSCLHSAVSVRQAARFCGINKDTAFRWRHRFLWAVLNQAADVAYGSNRGPAYPGAVAVPMKGPVQIGERRLLRSQKGERGLWRQPRTRGARHRVPSPAAWILIAVGEEGGLVATFAGGVRPSARTLAEHLDGLIEDGRPLFGARGTCGPQSQYARWRDSPYELLRVRLNDTPDLPGNFWREFRKWLERFRGVASRYLNSYLAWQPWISGRADWRVVGPAWLEDCSWVEGSSSLEDRSSPPTGPADRAPMRRNPTPAPRRPPPSAACRTLQPDPPGDGGTPFADTEGHERRPSSARP